MYEKEFIEALERTNRFGLCSPEYTETTTRYLSDTVIEELPHVVCNHIGLVNPNQLILQCLSINIRLKTILSEYFKCPIYYTIGHVKINDEVAYEQTEETLFSMLKNGNSSPTVDLHAWLTLPSMELIDLSIASSYAKINRKPEVLGNLISLHPSELTKGLSFHPMLIGEVFLEKIGALRLFTFPETV